MISHSGKVSQERLDPMKKDKKSQPRLETGKGQTKKKRGMISSNFFSPTLRNFNLFFVVVCVAWLTNYPGESID